MMLVPLQTQVRSVQGGTSCPHRGVICCAVVAENPNDRICDPCKLEEACGQSELVRAQNE